jgi:prepilin signal peptidase PulO-like enzyme (type II secretory pathway)
MWISTSTLQLTCTSWSSKTVDYNYSMVYAGVILLGLGAGWLVNYLADVLPRHRRFVRADCPNCSTPYPLIDYLLFRPCRACAQTRGWRPFLTQLFFLAGISYIWLHPPLRLGFWLAYILLIFLAVVFVIDVEHRLILHPVSMIGAVLGLAIGTFLHGFYIALIGGAVGFGSMLVLYHFGEVFARFMSKRRGLAIEEVALGFGDVNLGGIIGLLLGWPLIVFGLLSAILVGGAFSFLFVMSMLIRRRYEAFTAIPYAPFMILSVIYALFF